MIFSPKYRPNKNIAMNPKVEPKVETNNIGVKSTLPNPIIVPIKRRRESPGAGGKRFSIKGAKKANKKT